MGCTQAPVCRYWKADTGLTLAGHSWPGLQHTAALAVHDSAAALGVCLCFADLSGLCFHIRHCSALLGVFAAIQQHFQSRVQMAWTYSGTHPSREAMQAFPKNHRSRLVSWVKPVVAVRKKGVSLTSNTAVRHIEITQPLAAIFISA